MVKRRVSMRRRGVGLFVLGMFVFAGASVFSANTTYAASLPAPIVGMGSKCLDNK